MLERKAFNSREEWLAGRGVGIGASEAAAVVNLSPWSNPTDLYRLKTGLDTPKDLSDNAAVAQGVRMEPAIRVFFAAKHPELSVDYHAYDILYQRERPWLFATLDGELTETETGRRGILEIKTATPNGKAGWEKWNGNIPKNYFVQVLHQMIATGFDFVYLFAALYSMNGDITLREYQLEREDFSDDIKWLLKREEEFWRCVQSRTPPPMPIIL